MNSLTFSLGTFSVAGCPPFPGLVLAGRVLSLYTLNSEHEATGVYLSGVDSLASLLENWDTNLSALQKITELLDQGHLPRLQARFIDAQQLRIHAPIPVPRQIFCTGANYRKHVLELAFDVNGGVGAGSTPEERRTLSEAKMNERAKNGLPYAFIKLPSAVTGPYDNISLPASIEQPDWELELAVIIGRRARHVSRERAMDCVAGYTIGNDVSARDRLYRQDLRTIGTDWMSCKSPPSFLPMGPYLVPAAFVADPGKLHLQLTLNGEVMQDALTSDMIFDIARQIEYLSERVELWPGDVILTGSPAGNGTHFKRFLQPGDQMVGSIGGLGEMRNVCVAEGTCA